MTEYLCLCKYTAAHAKAEVLGFHLKIEIIANAYMKVRQYTFFPVLLYYYKYVPIQQSFIMCSPGFCGEK